MSTVVDQALADSTIAQRVLTKYVVDLSTGCWMWTGAKSTAGYGYVRAEGRGQPAHRVLYMLHVGPIPEGLTLDHLCRTPACVNPEHLEPVTGGENTLRGESPWAQRARQTHCIHGHLLDETNTYIRREGWRQCKRCSRLRKKGLL